MFQTVKVNLSNGTPFSRTCDDFLSDFWDAKFLKSEQNFKNIWKFPNHNLTNNFVENFDIYSKGHNQIQAMSHPFKGPVTIFWVLCGQKHCQKYQFFI